MHAQLNALALESEFLPGLPPVDAIVAARFEGRFYRAQVTDNPDLTNHRRVSVYFVDYGE